MAAGAPVGLHAQACLELRSRYAECGHCARNCPPGAIRISSQGMALEETCIGCGRCVAACPTGALRVQGFELRPAPGGENRRPVTVDCWTAPASSGAEIRVPCLGGLPVSQLLELRVSAGLREVAFLDRGWCATCPAGKGKDEHPLMKSLERARARMREAGVPEALLPRLAQAPLPLREMSDELSAPRVARRTNRRRFFARLAPHSAGTVALQRSAPPLAAAERKAVLKSLGMLAARHGGTISPRLFHALEVDARCDGSAVCASTCPTGALRSENGAGGGALSHDAMLCIGCAHCERVCPKGALRVRHGEGSPGAPRLVARFALRECDSCGEVFRVRSENREENGYCERCAKSRRLAHSAFQQLFGAQVRPAP